MALEAEEANGAMSQFLANMRDEIRVRLNPLTDFTICSLIATWTSIRPIRSKRLRIIPTML
nr:hypothetical protein [Desulfobacterales bacterium]